MSVPDLSALNRFRRVPPPTGYPANVARFFAPVDNVHGVLTFLLSGAKQSLVVAMYGFDDPALAFVLTSKLEDPHCHVQITLDAIEASGKHERELLAKEDYPATSIAIGHSEHGAIMHLKQVVIDGWLTICGSTNWSGSAETKQDNELTVIADPYVAAEARARIDAIHANMLAKQPKRATHADAQRAD